MTPFTPAQREALAKLVGISPETHRHLFNNVCQCGSETFNVMVAGDYDVAYCDGCESRWDDMAVRAFRAPCPLTGGDEADDVWLAPLMRWLVSVDRAHGVGPSFHKEPERAWAANFYHGCFPEYGATATSALLHSCRAAGVPEVCAIFDMGKETEK